MSKALDYLMQARPGTMGAYFDFLRRSGERLDPKTRALISVITKAANRTDRGLRQYVTRALEAGVTADEILDALLFAFPVLGLSRIVWAIDVLLDMDLPEFRPENLGVVPGWHELVAVSDLPSDGTHFTGAAGRSFIVHRSGDEISVYDNRCPHQSTELTAAGLEGLLRAIAEGGGVSAPASAEMLDILHDQRFVSGIPAGLPDGARVANKTGEISTVVHDAGVVYLPDRDPYVIVVLTEWPEDGETSRRRKLIAEISKLVLERFVERSDG